MKRLLKWLLPNHPDVECGLHSGFSSCCILFFILFWCPVLCGEMWPFSRWKKRGLTIRHRYIDYTERLCERKGLRYDVITPYPNGLPDGAKGYVKGDVWVIHSTVYGFGRIACPWCILFSKHVGSVKCECTYKSKRVKKKQ